MCARRIQTPEPVHSNTVINYMTTQNVYKIALNIINKYLLYMQGSRDPYSTVLGISEWKDYSGIFTSSYFLHYLDILQKTPSISLVRKKKKKLFPFWFLIQYGFKERMISKFNIFNLVSQYLSNMSIESHIIWAKKKKTVATTEAKLLNCHVPKGMIYTILSTQNEFWNTRSNFNFQREKKSLKLLVH